MDKVDQGLLRCIWAAGMNSSLILYRAGLVGTTTCPLCGASCESDEHIFWERPALEEARALLWRHYTKEAVGEQPDAVRLRGMVLDNKKLDDAFVEIAQKFVANEVLVTDLTTLRNELLAKHNLSATKKCDEEAGEPA